MTEREQFDRQENWKKIHAALEGYAALASHMNDEVCQSYCEEWQRALEAVKIAEEEENRIANLEQAARATPALPQGLQITGNEGGMGFDRPRLFAEAPAKALPQGVEEWIEGHTIKIEIFDEPAFVARPQDVAAYLSGMAIVPVGSVVLRLRDAQMLSINVGDQMRVSPLGLNANRLASSINALGRAIIEAEAMLAAAKESPKTHEPGVKTLRYRIVAGEKVYLSDAESPVAAKEKGE